MRLATYVHTTSSPDERDAIVRAAFGLIGKGATGAVSVQQILAAAGLSTWAFYRHFRSKDELIISMYRSAADRVAVELTDVVAASSGPAAALEAWIHHQLAVVYDPGRARQTKVLSSLEARAANGFEQANHRAAMDRRAVLAGVIHAGQLDGSFPASTDADEDARAVTSVVGGIIQAHLAGDDTPGWAEATAHTTELFLRAFGRQ